MPIPKPNPNEDTKDFVSRCMDNPKMGKEYPDNKQRLAVCIQQTKKTKGRLLDSVLEFLGFSMIYNDCEECGSEELFTETNYVEPQESDYVESKEKHEDTETVFLENIFATYTYQDPITNEMFYFKRPGIYKKNDRVLVFVSKAAKYQGRTVQLNKPFRTPDGPKKFSVYVKNDKGNIVKVNFGQPGMEIKRDDPERRKSFRARHGCDKNPGPRWKAKYWSCKQWRSNKKVEG